MVQEDLKIHLWFYVCLHQMEPLQSLSKLQLAMMARSTIKMLDWPKSSTKFPYGTYTVEAITSTTGENLRIDVKFSASTEA